MDFADLADIGRTFTLDVLSDTARDTVKAGRQVFIGGHLVEVTEVDRKAGTFRAVPVGM